MLLCRKLKTKQRTTESNSSISKVHTAAKPTCCSSENRLRHSTLQRQTSFSLLVKEVVHHRQTSSSLQNTFARSRPVSLGVQIKEISICTTGSGLPVKRVTLNRQTGSHVLAKEVALHHLSKSTAKLYRKPGSGLPVKRVTLNRQIGSCVLVKEVALRQLTKSGQYRKTGSGLPVKRQTGSRVLVKEVTLHQLTKSGQFKKTGSGLPMKRVSLNRETSSRVLVKEVALHQLTKSGQYRKTGSGLPVKRQTGSRVLVKEVTLHQLTKIGQYSREAPGSNTTGEIPKRTVGMKWTGAKNGVNGQAGSLLMRRTDTGHFQRDYMKMMHCQCSMEVLLCVIDTVKSTNDSGKVRAIWSITKTYLTTKVKGTGLWILQ